MCHGKNAPKGKKKIKRQEAQFCLHNNCTIRKKFVIRETVLKMVNNVKKADRFSSYTARFVQPKYTELRIPEMELEIQ